VISFSVVLFAHTAYAGFITQSDFDSTAIVTDLNDLGIPTGNVAAPLRLLWALMSLADPASFRDRN
jgi:hypothetical protein